MKKLTSLERVYLVLAFNLAIARCLESKNGTALAKDFEKLYQELLKGVDNVKLN